MRRNHPFIVLLALLLGLGVLASSLVPFYASPSKAASCSEADDEDVRESLEELTDEQFDFSDNYLFFTYEPSEIRQPAGVLLKRPCICKVTSFHFSFGWSMPLRI